MRNKIIIVLFIIANASMVLAQNKGVRFENNLSWTAIQAKAQTEHKDIFVDCYATWCGPCKEMDRIVYPLEKVGQYLNDQFISVKVQMDVTPNDTPNVKSWYADAKMLQANYHVNAYPTYLFFSPDGKIIHRGLGLQTADDFIAIARKAVKSGNEYYMQIDSYRSGKKNYPELGKLALKAKELRNKIADTIAADYKMNYLDKLSPAELCTKDNLDFIAHFALLVNSGDNFFKLFYCNPQKADSIGNLLKYNALSRWFVDNTITREEITSKIWKDNQLINANPDWEKISNTIVSKYGKNYEKTLVPSAKLDFYERIKDWPHYVQVMNEEIVTNPPDTAQHNPLATNSVWSLNSSAWDVFEGTNDRACLEAALQWSDLALKLHKQSGVSMYMDTKANLLYRLGRIAEAVALEKKAVDDEEGPDAKAIWEETLAKMEKSQPTWKVAANDNAKP